MPEGHTIHRIARRLNADGAGGRIGAASPQGHFREGAAALDGSLLVRAEALGKHLLLHFEPEATLHVHLGLFGRFVRRRTPAPVPRQAVRLRLETRPAIWDLSGATICALLPPEAVGRLRGRVGADPLRGDDPAAALARIGSSRRAIGALLLDQRIVAGIGNVYRAEILHALKIDPRRRGDRTAPEERLAIWETASRMLAAGERSGRIRTLEGGRGPRLAVYRASECATCGGRVTREDMANRTMYWCPACQPAGARET